jgi:hypothetical protein
MAPKRKTIDGYPAFRQNGMLVAFGATRNYCAVSLVRKLVKARIAENASRRRVGPTPD